eukprot:4697465-Alexandrium_andersonii.AAC.1
MRAGRGRGRLTARRSTSGVARTGGSGAVAAGDGRRRLRNRAGRGADWPAFPGGCPCLCRPVCVGGPSGPPPV